VWAEIAALYEKGLGELYDYAIVRDAEKSKTS
jgi:hypothetical protein